MKNRKKKIPILKRPLEKAVKAEFRKLCQIPPFFLWNNPCGGVMAPSGYFIRYGVGNPGGSDTVGYESVLITPEMVGMTLAVFTVVELKRELTGILSPEQIEFLTQVANAGGTAIVADSPQEAFDDMRRAMRERIAEHKAKTDSN